jgi:hypothetical protein
MLPFMLYLVLGMIFLSGCAEKVLYPRYSPTVWSNYFQLQDINTGMTKQEVISRMGTPRVVEDGGKHGETFLFYQTHNMDKLGNETMRGGLTPLVFKEDRLVGIGRRPYNQAMDFPDQERTIQDRPMTFPDRQDNTQPYIAPPRW